MPLQKFSSTVKIAEGIIRLLYFTSVCDSTLNIPTALAQQPPLCGIDHRYHMGRLPLHGFYL
jgi:hypothetical protein